MSFLKLFSSSAPATQDRQTVVIVGGGYAGVLVARSLDQNFNVVLIDRKNYYLHNIAALRAVAQPDWLKFMAAPYDKTLSHGQFLQGEVEEITPESVKLFGHATPVTFDFLVIATGSSYRFPFKISAADITGMTAAFENVHKLLENVGLSFFGSWKMLD